MLLSFQFSTKEIEDLVLAMGVIECGGQRPDGLTEAAEIEQGDALTIVGDFVALVLSNSSNLAA